MRENYDSRIYDKANRPCAKFLQKSLLTPADVHSLAKYLGVSVQAVNSFKNGMSFPKTENLVKIAEYYSVSVEYLLGLSNTPNRDERVQALVNTTGLSTAAVSALAKLKDEPYLSRVLSALLEDKNLMYFLALIREILDSMNSPADQLSKVNINGRDLVTQDYKLLQFMLVTNFTETLPSIAKKYSSLKKEDE